MLEACKLVRFNGKSSDDDAYNCGDHFQFLQYVVAARHIETWPHKGQSLMGRVVGLFDGWVNCRNERLIFWMNGNQI